MQCIIKVFSTHKCHYPLYYVKVLECIQSTTWVSNFEPLKRVWMIFSKVVTSWKSFLFATQVKFLLNFLSQRNSEQRGQNQARVVYLQLCARRLRIDLINIYLCLSGRPRPFSISCWADWIRPPKAANKKKSRAQRSTLQHQSLSLRRETYEIRDLFVISTGTRRLSIKASDSYLWYAQFNGKSCALCLHQ